MIFLILQFAFLIISTVHVYKTAKSNGHNAVLWTLANIGVFLVIPNVIGFFLAVAMVIAVSGGQMAQSTMETLAWLLSYAMLGVGVAAVLWILKHVSKINEGAELPPPPSPKHFDLS
jgi:hypothetical protein